MILNFLFITDSKPNDQEDEKDPFPAESTVSNNNTPENVIQTIPTPDKSTTTQQPQEHVSIELEPSTSTFQSTSSGQSLITSQIVEEESTTTKEPESSKNEEKSKQDDEKNEPDYDKIPFHWSLRF